MYNCPEAVFDPGDVSRIPPRSDTRVVGNEPFVIVGLSDLTLHAINPGTGFPHESPLIGNAARRSSGMLYTYKDGSAEDGNDRFAVDITNGLRCRGQRPGWK